MSKRIVSAPLSRVERIGIVFGGGRSMSQVKAASGCDWIINGGLYDFGTGKPVFHLRAGGKTYAQDDGGAWGYAWDVGPDIIMTPIPADRKANYIACLALLTPWDGINAKLAYDKAALGGVRGRSAMAVGGGKLILYCSGDGTADGKTPEGLRQELYDMGAETALMLDSGGSSQCDFGGGQSIYSSRRVNNYICVWLKKDSRHDSDKEDKPVGNYIVTTEVGLNIRSAPAKTAPKMGGYSHGAVVTVLELQDGWARTDRGWVYAAYLRPVSQEADRTTDNGIAIQRDYIAKGRKNRPGRVNPRRYITIHETGNKAATADAAAHGAYLKNDSAEVGRLSWHYTVDDHAIVQHLPDGETAYHAGDGADGPGNTTSIGVEICVNAGGDFEASKRNAAALVRLLMGEHGIPLDHVVQHNHWNGKDCPKTIRGTKGGWEAFLALCGRDKPDQGTGTPAAAWAAEAWRKAKEKGIMDGTRPTESVTRQELAVVLDRLGLI